MFRKLASLLGLKSVAASASGLDKQGSPAPYKQAEINFIYNLLFCDDLSLFELKNGEPPTYWQLALFSQPPDVEAIRHIAENQDEESRIRAIAYNWLREHGHPVPSRQLFGVIVEVPVAGGLDTLAAYPDGRVRYINHTGKLAVFEAGVEQLEAKAKSLVASAIPAVDNMGPWDKKRLPPPAKEIVRMTFLVSDGLYFGQGPFALMEKEPLAAPVIQNAGGLLQIVMNLSTKSQATGSSDATKN
ncbi:hypothetical protein [Collimonas sp.]|jgi:hypothetical protein|uniref:hypothetical protein n=1 Tax=Collimonas sp. TaxID=1963772 RepID=UPI002B7E9DD9|nr:hypothetical protein [Collimonas sp.]HWX00240.1 hypothetical protein [Collimonas sp.]